MKKSRYKKPTHSINVLCTECKKPINEHGVGLVAWGWDMEKEPITFLHKGLCDKKYRLRYGGNDSYQLWQETMEYAENLNRKKVKLNKVYHRNP